MVQSTKLDISTSTNPKYDDNNLNITCEANYDDDNDLGFVGGRISREYNVAVTEVSFVIDPANAALVGEEIMLSCSVSSPTVPEFKFTDETGSLKKRR